MTATQPEKTTTPEVERLFSGTIGKEYAFIKQMCPNVPELHARIAALIENFHPASRQGQLKVVELGCGTGLLTSSLLARRADLELLAIDNEPAMLNQARAVLMSWEARGQVAFIEQDALSALQNMPAFSVDAVVSAYTLHNFLEGYRRKVIGEVFRVLKPGGWFLNGDRYALDDIKEHTQAVQDEVRHFFRIFTAMSRYDLLEQWIVHLLSDESQDHIMRAQASVAVLREAGFDNIRWLFRQAVDGLIAAERPTDKMSGAAGG